MGHSRITVYLHGLCNAKFKLQVEHFTKLYHTSEVIPEVK